MVFIPFNETPIERLFMLDIEKLIQEIIVFTQTLRVDVKSGDLPDDTADLIDMRDAMKDCLDIIQVIIDVRSVE